MERAELLQNLESWVRQLGGTVTVAPPQDNANDLPELPFQADESPAMTWLSGYLAEADKKYVLGRTVRPGTLASVGELPTENVTEFEAGYAALTVMMRLFVGRTFHAWKSLILLRAAITYLFPRIKPTSQAEPLVLLELLAANPDAWSSYGLASYIPTPQVLRAALRMIKQIGWTPQLRKAADVVQAGVKPHTLDAERRKVLNDLTDLLDVMPVEERLIDPQDDWGMAAQSALQAMPAAQRASWVRLLTQAAAASGARPTAAWLRETRALVQEQGADRVRPLLDAWLGLLGERGGGTPLPPVGWGDFRPSSMIADRNSDLLRGLAWTCLLFDDPAMARTVGWAAQECFRKIPQFGSRSTKAGNACVYVLSQLGDIRGVAQLQELQQRLKLPSIQKVVDSALRVASERSGMTREDLEELSVPSFGLVDGRVEWQLGEYRAEIVVDGASASTRWYGPDGKQLRTEPAVAKREAPDAAKAVKQASHDLPLALSAQRDRLDGLYLKDRAWSLPAWRERYLDHALLSNLARRLIWEFRAGERRVAGAWLDGELVDANDRPIAELTDDTQVGLWHPIGASTEDVLAWREWIGRHQLTQPFKQAHREIYLLTDAEQATDTYSNRFAAHVLRQHQFSALCQQRGWVYRLQGPFDGWNAPTRKLPHAGLQVQFHVEGAEDDAAPMSRAGIFLYVTTDRVRFLQENGRTPVHLADVPPLVLSEVMRDVDLFVGVCSVGNDPTWATGGPQNHQAYWSEYANAELSTSALSRRAVLATVLPRLKIADRCTLEERHLVVRGDLHTYRIHLGSGNILMESNNRYLCIVPARGGGVETSGLQLYLPFEGDSLLSIILSKAFLLADDRAIKDPSILSQMA